jgi:hypothetical protein
MPATRAWGNGPAAKHATNGKPALRNAQAAKDSTLDFPDSDGEVTVARPAKPAPRSAKTRAPAKAQKRAPLTDDEPQTSDARVSKSKPTSGSDVFDFPVSADDGPRPKAVVKRTQKAAGGALTSKGKRRDTPATEDSDASRKRKRAEQPPKKPAAKQSMPLRHSEPKELAVKPANKHTKRASPPSASPPLKAAAKPRGKKTTPAPVKEPPAPSLADMDLDDYPARDEFRTPSPPRSRPPENNQGSITPRQAVMWSKLLDHTNKALLRADASNEDGRGAGSQRLSPIPQSSSDPGEDRQTKRVRLVDTLKNTTRHLPVEESSSEDDESSDGDVNGHDMMNSQSSNLPQSQPMVKITYGQQRTFMEEEDDMLETLMDDADETPKALGSHHPVDLGPTSDEEDEPGQPKSIHDLRAAGSKKQLLHELESLISGIKGEAFGSAGAKRMDLLELTKKLLDPTTSQFFLDHGLEKGLVACLAKSTDTMFDFIGALALNCLLKTKTSLSSIRHIWSSGCLDRLLKLLTLDLDIARTVKERRFNLSKVSQGAIAETKPAILDAEIWSDPAPSCLSPRIVALTSIERLIRKTRELGNSDVLADESTITQLVETQNWDGPSPDHDLEVELTISALESSSVGMSLKAHNPWTAPPLQRLATHLPALLLSTAPALARARNLALRLALNITNNNRAACDEFAAREGGFAAALMALVNRDFPRVVGAGGDGEGSVLFDELILSLGAAINLAELSDAARERALDEGGKVLRETVALFQAGLDKTEQVSLEPRCIPHS